MEPLKGLILSDGTGTLLCPITHTSTKHLVPVANKLVPFCGIEAMVGGGGRVCRPEVKHSIVLAEIEVV